MVVSWEIVVLDQGELIPTKCHLASKISGLAVLSYRKMPPGGFRDASLWLNSGHGLRKSGGGEDQGGRR